MRALCQIRHLLLSLFARRRLESSLDEEMRQYLDEIAQRKMHAGLPEAEAWRQARVEFEGIEQVKEQVRDARLGATLASALRDLRIGLRTLRRAPAFSLAAILTLGFSIGMNVTVFSIMRSLLWRPLPYPGANRIVMLTFVMDAVKDAGAAPGEILALRERSRTLERIGVFSGVAANVDAGGEMEHAAAASVSDDILPLLGASPAIGRTLNSKQDEGPGAVRSVVISDALWRRRFGADPNAVGRVVQINNLPMSVVGVLRPEFRVFLPPSTNAAEDTDVWFPTGIGNEWGYRGFPVLARLRAHVTLAQAQAELDGLAAAFMREHPEAYTRAKLRLSVNPLQDVLTRGARPALGALAAAVAFVLLIGCINVANLSLARAKGREQELAVRGALGASRLQLTRLLFAESLLLSGAACIVGLLLGQAGLQGLAWLKPDHLPLHSQIAMDGTVAAFAVALSMACSFAFGLLPALRLSTQRDPRELKAGRGGGLTENARRLQRALVIAEVALSIVPLMAAGLMLRTFANLVHAPIGFDPEHLLTAKMPMNYRTYPDAASRWRVVHNVLDRLERLPGVERASAASPLPFAPMQITRRYSRAEQTGGAMPLATQQTIAPGYLPLAGIALRSGRDFTLSDIEAQRQVVIVDERLAAQLWPPEEAAGAAAGATPGAALGRRMAIWIGQRKIELEVVGVTRAVRMTQVTDAETPHFFTPYHVFPVEMSLVIKTAQPAAALAPAVQRLAMEAGTRRAIFDVRPMKDYVEKSIGGSRFLMLILTGFAAASLFLAAMGLYGTLAYLVAQRTHELGIRIALGASARQIVSMVMREGVQLTALGVSIGAAGSWAVTHLLRGFLYNVHPFDGLTLAGVAAVMALAALASAGAPAWRASRMDPNAALRHE